MKKGHNIGVAGEQLKAFIDRIESRESDKADVAADIKEIYAELKSSGFDAKIVRKIVALRKKSEEDRREESQLLETYMSQLQMNF